MTVQLSELELILEQLIAEHEALLRHLESQQSAMKKLDMPKIEELVRQQEVTRLRIAALDTRRRALVSQIGAALRLGNRPTIAQLAAAAPTARPRLLTLRNRLKQAIEAVSSRAQVAGRVAGAVLGHLNTAVRLLAGAVDQPGTYTKHGIPRASPRIGLLEAVA